MAEDDDDTVYCDIQMPVAQGRELLNLVSALRESKAHRIRPANSPSELQH